MRLEVGLQQWLSFQIWALAFPSYEEAVWGMLFRMNYFLRAAVLNPWVPVSKDHQETQMFTLQFRTVTNHSNEVATK